MFVYARRRQFASVAWFAGTVASCAIAVALFGPKDGAGHDEHFAQAMFAVAFIHYIGWFASVSSLIGVVIACRTSSRIGRVTLPVAVGILANGSLLLLSFIVVTRTSPARASADAQSNYAAAASANRVAAAASTLLCPARLPGGRSAKRHFG